jgi:hypothetical protein
MALNAFLPSTIASILTNANLQFVLMPNSRCGCLRGRSNQHRSFERLLGNQGFVLRRSVCTIFATTSFM